MSWTFRKIFRLGPMRTALSKGGLGMSWGIPGFRFGVSANGRKYITIGIPGTGLYFTKYLSNQVKPPPQSINQKQQPTTKNQNNEPWWKQKHL
ncbi:MAG: DUF4236 domain-containing protein [Spirosomataceae bacterium]